MTVWTQREERLADSLRDAEAVLNAAVDSDGFITMPTDPELQDNFNRAVRLVHVALGNVRETLKREDGND